MQTKKTSKTAEGRNPARQVRRPVQERGIARYNQLLDATQELLLDHELEDLGLYQIAKKAGIPPASAYHFFATPGDALLGLARRYLPLFGTFSHGISEPPGGTWQGLISHCLRAEAALYEAHPQMRKLFLGCHTTMELALCNVESNELLAKQVVGLLDQLFHMPFIRNAEERYLVTVTSVDAIWRLSQTRHGCITADFLEHSTEVAIAHCRSFLPDRLELR